MTDQEMILLKSCIRLSLVTIINEARNKEAEGESLFFGDFSEDLRAVMHNVSMGVFGEKSRGSYDKYEDNEEGLIKDLESLLLRVDNCDKSFDGYMLV